MREPTGPGRIAVLGEGLLADAIVRAFGCAHVRRADLADPVTIEGDIGMAVAATDSWDTHSYPSVRKRCAGEKAPWLPVRAELGRVVIGPAELPRTPGCADCAETRRRMARRHRRGHDAVWLRHGDAIRQRPSSWLTTLGADLVAALVADEARRLAADPDTARTRNALLYVDLRTLGVTTHRFLPDPHCPACGRLPIDDAVLARIDLQPRPKPTPGVYRLRAVADEMDALWETYVDTECGLVRELYRDSHGGVVVAAAPLGLRDGQVEKGYGRTRSRRASELGALLEALERYGGVQPGGKRTVVRASYRDVASDALYPKTLGLHAQSAYRLPEFRLAPFDENRPYRWVWGYSFGQKAPILVPEAYAYYGTRPAHADSAPFVHEISNGCALGASLEEAILYGILEVAERDAFLMTWYANMRVPRVDPRPASSGVAATMADTIQAETGYQVMLFDITLEQGIPSVWAMAVDPADDGDGPKVVCAAGSHFEPERAAVNALSELGPILAEQLRTHPEQRERAREMAGNPALVTTMADHALVNGDRTIFHRFDFLTRSTRVRSFADMTRSDAFHNDDLRDDLLEAIGRYLECGLDVIAVDQTTPEHRAGGFACVKVIIPGTLPLTSGHRYRRVEGLPRLYEVPRLLGHRERRLGPEEINPHPHPFA
ncbi:TOMM precursor leader peptide-binding protein [Streptosporangiaceae bacterium NEAU-GS5]|nr:TOMM precursor leader peptide-binding protein [Streptosporangiaceae bacterium NEAU-GS5]